jgi:hypothetical protein
LNALVDRVRRRLIGNELLAQGVNASNAALSALILLLLLGTQVLDWYWIALVPAVCAAIGLYVVRRRTPGRYAVAQLVDARLGLDDAISTAVYFHDGDAGNRGAEQVRRYQAEHAEKLAASVDPRRAVPFRMPRTVYLLAGLFLVAGSLFALRYGMNRTLDLKPPLARMLQQQFGWNAKKDLARNDRRKNAPQQADPEDQADSKEQNQKGASQPDPAGNDQGSADTAAADQKGTASDEKKQSDNGSNAGDQQEAQAEKASDSANDQANANQQQNGKSDPQQNSGRPSENNSGDNSSLMSKLKDALASLMPRQNPPKGQQDQGNQDKQNGQQSSGKPQQGKNGQQSADQQGDAQDGQQGENGQDQQQDPNGKSSGKNDGQQKSKQPGSGIGSQDGDKSIKQAQQLDAMGKLSEIYGKRAANITGEATVEVQSTNQQLKTQYVQRGAQHSQAGTEIDRDVVPVSLQGYVEQYFEQLRKQSPAPGKGTPSKTAAPAADKNPAEKKQ